MLEGLPTCMSGIDSAKFGLSKGAPILGQGTLMSAYFRSRCHGKSSWLS